MNIDLTQAIISHLITRYKLFLGIRLKDEYLEDNYLVLWHFES